MTTLILRFLPVLAVFIGLAISGLFMMLLGQNPLVVFIEIVRFAFRDIYNIADIFAKATPLILTGLAFGFSFRGNLFNIGAQGQFLIGALAAVSCALAFPTWPGYIVLPLCFIAAALAGGSWAAWVGWLKARFSANEFLVSMMSTYLAIGLADFFIRGPLKESKGEYPQTNMITESAWIPSLVEGTRWHWGFIIALLIAGLAWFILMRTGLGFRIRAVGLNRQAANYAGINQNRIFISTFFLAGSFAGIAGMMEVNGLQHMLVQNFQPTLGAEGIGIAILGNSHPVGIVFSALLFGILKVGGLLVTQTTTIPPSIIGIMEGCVMLAVILSYFIRKILLTRQLKQDLATQAGGL